MSDIVLNIRVSINASLHPTTENRSSHFSMKDMRLPNGVNVLPLFEALPENIDKVLQCVMDSINCDEFIRGNES